MVSKQSSCTDSYETGLISVEQALKQIISSLPTVDSYQFIPIEKARGRTLAQAIIAPFKVPNHDNSAVDGYAFSAKDISGAGITSLTVLGAAYAGKPFSDPISSGQCISIMTGAIIPKQTDTVIMLEHVALKKHVINFDRQYKKGQNVRLAGEDIQQNEIILHPGKYITPADIGLIASLGICEIKVKKKLTIAIASTGNEIISPGNIHSSSGSIYDSNKYILLAALDRPDIEIINLGIIEDNPDALLNSFNQASQFVDMIISTGGVSAGDADFTKIALKQSGQIVFWKIAIKPGRPLAFGKLGNSVFFGLPGNPVAVMVTFYQFVLPALEAMLGTKEKAIAPQFKVKTKENLRKIPGRTEIVRGILQQDSTGEWEVKSTGKQGSGILQSMSLANAFIILEHDRDTVKAGELVTVQPFAGIF